MATYSAVTRQHVLQAIGEYDSRGQDDFLGVYGFAPLAGYALLHEGRVYDVRAVLGVAHRYATGRLATAHEFGNDATGAAAILRKRGFDVTEPVGAAPVAPVRRAPARRAPAAPRATARPTRAVVEERVAPTCPTCSTALPATGICDYCS